MIGSSLAGGPAPKDSDTFTVVCHGTITHRMGLDLAVRAVGLLRERIPQVAFAGAWRRAIT